MRFYDENARITEHTMGHQIMFCATEGSPRALRVLAHLAKEGQRTQAVASVDALPEGPVVYLYDEPGRGHYSHRGLDAIPGNPRVVHGFAFHPRLADHPRLECRAAAAARQIIATCCR